MSMKKPLIKHQLFLDGKWCGPVSEKYDEVVSPATGEVISQCATGDDRDAKKAIHAAYHAFKTWSRISAAMRSEYLLRIYELLLGNEEELAYTISVETGKPLREARLEVNSAANCIVWNAEEGKRAYGDVIPSPNHCESLHAIKQPLGPIAAITPQNYPLSLTMRKIIPALAAGCTVVLKSDSQTLGSATVFFRMVEKANLPDGVLNLLTGHSTIVGDALVKDPRIKRITYTGSAQVGTFLMEKAATEAKSVSLDFDNLAPFIVFEDANLDEAVEEFIETMFRNIPRNCVDSTKVYVQQSIAVVFYAKLKERAEQLVIGNGLDERVQFGPVANDQILSTLKSQVKDALAKGAALITGGKQRIIPGYEKGFYFEPTIFAAVDEKMRIANEEKHGFLVPIFTFETEAEVVEKAKQSCTKLSMRLFTNDLSRSIRVADALGNDLFTTGMDSKIDDLNEFLETKFIAIGM